MISTVLQCPVRFPSNRRIYLPRRLPHLQHPISRFLEKVANRSTSFNKPVLRLFRVHTDVSNRAVCSLRTSHRLARLKTPHNLIKQTIFDHIPAASYLL